MLRSMINAYQRQGSVPPLPVSRNLSYINRDGQRILEIIHNAEDKEGVKEIIREVIKEEFKKLLACAVEELVKEKIIRNRRGDL